MCILFRSA